MRETAIDLLRHQIETHDPVSQTWATWIAPGFAQLCWSCRIPFDQAMDWIAEREGPVNLFEFSRYAHEQRRIVPITSRRVRKQAAASGGLP